MKSTKKSNIIKQFIAKSDGTLLVDHSLRVAELAIIIANRMGITKDVVCSSCIGTGKKTQKTNSSKKMRSIKCTSCDGTGKDKNAEKRNIDILNYVWNSAILHDIGKCTDNMQNYLKSNKKSKIKYLHNEIGWAFLTRCGVENKINNYVLDAVYWHHGIFSENNMAKYDVSNICTNLSDSDVKNMDVYLNTILNVLKDVKNPMCDDYGDSNKKAPQYYFHTEEYGIHYRELNLINTIVRTCVISADRMSDDISGCDYQKYVDSYINKNSNVTILNDKPYKNSQREKDQKQIAEDIKSTNVIIKAQAGYGKTFIATWWSMKKRNKKLIWVCPRNVVADNVYKSVLSELTNMGCNASVELYYTNEVKDCNASDPDNHEAFTSDIIITNIDSYLTPNINNTYLSRLFLITTCDVVFDEFHELIGDSPIFALFEILMRVRMLNFNNRTILLSATPSLITTTWTGLSGICEKTQILPNETEHYEAIHNKQYELNVFEIDQDVNNLDVKKYRNNNLVVFNSISNTQIYKNGKMANNSILIHSKFQEKDRHDIIESIYTEYDKRSKRVLKKRNVVSAPLIRCSVDISFANVYESINSPESSLQTLGRNDRFGDYRTKCSFNMFKLINNDSENKVVSEIYNADLQKLWYQYMLKHDGKKLTLNEFYRLYNDFNIIYKDDVVKYIQKKLSNSKEKLSKLYPIKFINGKTKTDNIKADSNKLRSTGNEVFYICKKYINGITTDDYSDAFSTKKYSTFAETFNRNEKTSNIIKLMKFLSDDDRFSFKELLESKKNNPCIEDIHNKAKFKKTPYIAHDRIYHPVYGVIEEKTIQKFAH